MAKRKDHSLRHVARMGALRILAAGALHTRWTVPQRRQWTSAFNALQALAGVKTRIKGGKLTSKG